MGAQGMLGAGSQGGDSMFSSETASGVMPKAEMGSLEGQATGQSQQGSTGTQGKMQEEDEEL